MNQVNQQRDDDRWRGKRYICLVRQSDASGDAVSLTAQLKRVLAEGDKCGMRHVGTVVEGGER